MGGYCGRCGLQRAFWIPACAGMTGETAVFFYYSGGEGRRRRRQYAFPRWSVGTRITRILAQAGIPFVANYGRNSAICPHAVIPAQAGMVLIFYCRRNIFAIMRFHCGAESFYHACGFFVRLFGRLGAFFNVHIARSHTVGYAAQ